MMRALVTQFVAALIVAALAIGTIATLHSSKPTSLQPIKVVGIDELPNGSGLMSCADASQACLGTYEPALIITPSQVIATRWVSLSSGALRRSTQLNSCWL